MIIAIDGPAGSGKSSTAKEVAKRLHFLHLDTGAMYRAVTLKALRSKIDYSDVKSLGEMVHNMEISFSLIDGEMKTFIDSEDVSKEIRSDEVTKSVPDYCKPKEVRDELVALQRVIGFSNDTVCEGRDMGTVVFPKADLKYYMIASVETRAKRRLKDFEKMGVKKSVEELIADIELRDKKDSERDNSPLYAADDAIKLDTTEKTFEEQVSIIVETASEI